MAAVQINAPLKNTYNPQNPLNFNAGPPATSPGNGSMGASTVLITYQVNDGPVVQLPAGQLSYPNLTWSLPNLTDTDCPAKNTWYTLTLVAWDNNGSASDQCVFFRGN